MDSNQKQIKKILRESTFVDEKKDDKPTDSQYDRVKKLLDNDIFNHAAIVEKLWGSKNATKRSLFGKKLNRYKNQEGGTYEFSKEELSKIISILNNTSSIIKNSFKTKDNM